MLVVPDWKKKFQVYVDVSNFAIGNAFSQKDDKSFDHPIYFASRHLTIIENNYTITKIETLGMTYYV
jgi:hypothetical protein